MSDPRPFAKIPSFTIDHLRLLRGCYVSRQDRFGPTVLTTFDLRMKEPNREPVMDIPAIHSLEHLGATWFRNSPVWGPRTVYFGPMGCRTGCYLVLEGDLSSADIIPALKDCFAWILAYEGDVPGASAKDCGNWRDHNLEMAQYEARIFQTEVLDRLGPENLRYPE